LSKATVIIVNGGSSAGKTSMCKAFQDIAAEPFFLLGIDLFWFCMPPKEVELQSVSEGYYKWVQEESDGKSHFRILPGPLLNECMLARYKAMTSYLDRGLNLIADELFWTREWLMESLKVLAPYRTYYTGVFCQDPEISRREIQRGDRYCGWARGSQIYAHQFAKYDLMIDSTNRTPLECAEHLADYIRLNTEPKAADKMRADFAVGADTLAHQNFTEGAQ
jgi:chloramphenicol 3-O phosphotransferase